VKPDFEVATSVVGNAAVVVSVDGEADLYTAPQLKEALVRTIDDGCKFVLVDLTHASFIDSTTLGVLMGAVKRVRPQGGELAIACQDANIRKIFEITRLDQVFPVLRSREEGEEHVRRLADGHG
jgi:anti-sigma B factor antagonist